MTVLHFLESISPFALKKGWLRWEDGLARSLQCPACHFNGQMNTQRSVASPYSKHRRFRLYDCPECGTAYFPDISPPPYEDQSHGGQKENFTAPSKFYVEQGAGFEPMIAPFFWLPKNTIKSLLEVGCGYGFSLDFAARALGWNAQGVDPSHIARTGSSELGIPIMAGYLNADTKLEGMPFDLVFSSEVIEHIADPDPFVDVLAMAAGKQGTLLLTTPDIEGLRQERAVEEIIPLLSPGSHLVLFSKNGLDACLKRAGFKHVNVWSTGDTLYAFASNHTIDIDFSTPIDRPLLSKYLQDKLKKKNLPHHLKSGFAGRLLRAQTDDGDYNKAKKTLGVLVKHWKEIYDIDLLVPETIGTTELADTDFASYADMHPFNLVSVLYCAGILALNATQDKALALAYFTACSRNYQVLEPVLTNVNVAEITSRQLAQYADILRAGLIMHTNPAKAVVILETVTHNTDPTLVQQLNKTLMEVFTAAANSGEYSSAERLRMAVETDLNHKANYDEFERAAALGLAMIALNHHFDRPKGIFWLGKALEHAPDKPEWEGMREVWATHATIHGIELLSQGGQEAFATKRDQIGAALKTGATEANDFAVLEALGLAYLPDRPEEALFWLEKALATSDESHYAATAMRIDNASTRVFLDAVNAGDAKNATKTCKAIVALAKATKDPALHFALGLDALNRRGNLKDATKYFAALTDQQTHPDLAVQGAFHLALVLARKGKATEAQKVADTLYAKTNPNVTLVKQLVGKRQAELDVAITTAA